MNTTLAEKAATPTFSIVMEERKVAAASSAKAVAAKLDFWYGTNQALKNINLNIA